MTNRRKGRATAELPLLLALLTTGCDRDDPHPLVNEIVKRQAAQQESLVRQSEQLSDASRKLVESDAHARRDLVEFQSTLQTQIEGERQGLDQQRSDMEQERRDIAGQRHRDPLIAAALIQGATLIVAALPIVLIVMLLRAARQEPADVSMGELLVQEFTAERPILLPGPPLASRRLEHDHTAFVDDGPGAFGGNPPARELPSE